MSDAKPIRKKRRLLWWTLTLLLLGVVALAAFIFWPMGPIVIGPDTTVLTGPLNPDGTVNYVQALNDEYGKGVTPENNAAVLIAQAAGIGSSGRFGDEIDPRTWALVGIEAPPEKGDYFISIEALPIPPTTRPRESALINEYKVERQRQEDQHAATTRPWTEDRYPIVAEWLRKNEKPLALLVEASRRPRFFWPIISPSNPPKMIHGMFGPSGLRINTMAGALQSRAMLLSGQGKGEPAWQDALTLYRLGRLIGQNPSVIGSMVAVMLDNEASGIGQTLATSEKLTADQAKAMLAAVEPLQTPCDLAESFDKNERYLWLDCVAVVYRTPYAGVNFGGKNELVPQTNRIIIGSINWNQILREANRFCDNVVAFSRKSWAARQKADREAIEEIYARIEHNGEFTGVFHPTQAVGNLLFSILTPAVTQPCVQVDISEMNRHLLAVALALAAFHADHGNYPDKLDSLVPDYLKTIPKDIFTENSPLIYRREGAGYRLYSVGQNGKDDGGVTDLGPSHTLPYKDDIVVKVEK